MKTIKREVKTTTIIEFDRKDMADILYAAEQHGISGEFENFEMTMFSNFTPFSPEEMDFIARYYDFEGWTNAGYYIKDKDVRRMTMYNLGDSINE